MRPPMVFGIVMTRRVGSLGSVALGRRAGGGMGAGGMFFFPVWRDREIKGGGVAQAEQGWEVGHRCIANSTPKSSKGAEPREMDHAPPAAHSGNSERRFAYFPGGTRARRGGGVSPSSKPGSALGQGRLNGRSIVGIGVR